MGSWGRCDVSADAGVNAIMPVVVVQPRAWQNNTSRPGGLAHPRPSPPPRAIGCKQELSPCPRALQGSLQG